MLNFANILDAMTSRKYYGNWTKNEKNDHVRSHTEAQKQGKSIHFDPRFLESQIAFSEVIYTVFESE